jgi:hypothetical protein
MDLEGLPFLVRATAYEHFTWRTREGAIPDPSISCGTSTHIYGWRRLKAPAWMRKWSLRSRKTLFEVIYDPLFHEPLAAGSWKHNGRI